MPNIKLTYFDARGRAETTRLILAYAGVHFEDERITSKASKRLCQKKQYFCFVLIRVQKKTTFPKLTKQGAQAHFWKIVFFCTLFLENSDWLFNYSGFLMDNFYLNNKQHDEILKNFWFQGEQLADMKSSLAYGQLPKLEFDGLVLYQSVSIARWKYIRGR